MHIPCQRWTGPFQRRRLGPGPKCSGGGGGGGPQHLYLKHVLIILQ